MFVTLLSAVFILLVAPVMPPGSTVQAPASFRVYDVEFKNITDCDAAGRRWVPELTDAAFAPKHKLDFGNARTRYAPAGATVTYSCVEWERPQ